MKTILCLVTLFTLVPAIAYADACKADHESITAATCQDFLRHNNGLASSAQVKEALPECKKFYGQVISSFEHYCAYNNRRALLAEKAVALAQKELGNQAEVQQEVSALYRDMKGADAAYASISDRDINSLSKLHSSYLFQLRRLAQLASQSIAAERVCKAKPAFATNVPGFVTLALAMKAGPESWTAFEINVQALQALHKAAVKRAALSQTAYNEAAKNAVQAGSVGLPQGAAPKDLPLADAIQPPEEILTAKDVAAKMGVTFVLGFGTKALGGLAFKSLTDSGVKSMSFGDYFVYKNLTELGVLKGTVNDYVIQPGWARFFIRETTTRVIPGQLQSFFTMASFNYFKWDDFLVTGLSSAVGPLPGTAITGLHYSVKREVQMSQAYQAHAIPVLKVDQTVTASELRDSFCKKLDAGKATAH